MSQIDFSGNERSAASPLLTEAHIELLRRFGEEQTFEAGDVLFRPGDPTTHFLVVLEGRVAILDDHGRPDERLIIEHGPRGFAGEFNMISGQPALLTAVARESGRLLAVPLHDLRTLIASEAALSNVILGALLARRALLLQQDVGARIIGSRFSPDTRRLLEFAARNRVPHAWIDVETDPDVEALLRGLNVTPDEMPVVLLGEHVFNNPTNQDFARLLGFVPSPDHRDVYDLLVIGGGPAGLAAAVYGASEGLSTILIESVAIGGQAGTSSRIENYLGFPAGVSGAELAARAAIQAEKFEARLTHPCEAVSLEPRGGLHLVTLADGDEVVARSVIVATGASYRRLPLDRLDGARGLRRLLRGDARRGAHVRRQRRRRRRRRQLGGTGGAVPRRRGALCLADRAPAGSRRDDVPLPDRRDRARRPHRPHDGDGGRRAARQRPARRVDARRPSRRLPPPPRRRRALRLDRRRPAHRLADRLAGDGSRRIHPDGRRRGRGPRRTRSGASGCRSSRAVQASSPSATRAAARSSAWRRRSAKARWPCGSSTSTWPAPAPSLTRIRIRARLAPGRLRWRGQAA